MAAIHDHAVVLRQLDYSETSQVIVFLTREHGKVRAIGKGVRRSTKTRFATGVDLLDVGRLVVSSRYERSATLANIIEWKQTRALSGLREKLSRLYAGQYAAEIISHLTEDWDPHPGLFDALLGTLEALADAAEVLGPVVTFQRSLVEAIGSMPRFDACVLCGRGDDLTHFSSFEGGMICRHCEPGQIEKREVSRATLDVLCQKTDATASVGGFSLLNYHIAHLMGREPHLAAKLVPAARQRMVE